MSKKKKKQNRTTDQKVNDAFSNPLFRLGYGSQSPLEGTEYPLTRLTYDYQLLTSLYRSNWIVQNIVGIIPDDILKGGFELSGSVTPEQNNAFSRLLRQTKLYDRLNDGMKWGRLYGGTAGLILLRGDEDLSEPLDIDRILPDTFAGLYIADRWSGVTPSAELVQDMTDADFGKPEYYDFTMADGVKVAKVHHSRVVRFIGRELPYIERIAENHWGESEIEAIYSDIQKYDNVVANIAGLTFRANVDTMEVDNLDQLFSVASGQAQARFWNMLQAQSVLKSNFGTQLVNRGDKVNNTQYHFNGLKDVFESMCLCLSGASRIPATKLFGRSPEGMNATGESDLQNYYDYIDTVRENKLRPILEKLLPILCMSVFGGLPDDIDISFPPLWTPTAKETAEIAQKKTDTVISAFQSGLIDLATAQRELKGISDETGLFDMINDEEIAQNEGRTFQEVTMLHDPIMGYVGGSDE